jgi:hypothetical protein
MSVSLGAPSLDSTYAMCRKALDDLDALGIVTHEKIIPSNLVYNFSIDELASKIDTFGERMFDFVAHSQRLHVLRTLARPQMDAMKLPTAHALAVFAKVFKIGACDELSSIILTSSHVRALHTYRIIVLGQEKESGSTDDHVMLAFSHRCLRKDFERHIVEKKCDVRAALGSIDDLVLVDAYLGSCIKAQDISSSPLFLEKLSFMKNTHIRSVSDLTGKMEATKEVEALCEAFSQALSVFQTMPIPLSASQTPIMQQKRSEMILSQLHRIFPNVTWKVTKTGSFWTQHGDKAIVSSIKERLDAIGIETKMGKIKGSDNHLSSFECATYTTLVSALRRLETL